MTLPKLTLSTIKRNATDKSFSRGKNYWKSGAVVSLTQRQHVLQGEVEGNDPLPYRITANFDSGGITSARCSCPYAFEGWCKHIVATLIACIEQPDTIDQRPTLAQLLAPLTPDQTQGLVQTLVDDNPELIEAVEFYVTQLSQPKVGQAKRSKRKTSVDPAPFKRRVREILRSAVHDWEYGRDDDNIAYELEQLSADALAFAEQGDGHNAMVVMSGITEGCIAHWGTVYEFIGMGPDEFNIDLDTAWTEAILSTDLTGDEALEWQEKLEIWQQELGSFAMALEALRQGWDYPPLVSVLQGDISALGAWSGEAPTWADSFSRIRLKVLERQERYEEYLYLAEAEGCTQEYLTMLGQLGRTDEAVAVATEEMTTLAEAKSLAEILRKQNQLDQALDIAMRGLKFEEDRSPYQVFDFAVWTSELAKGLNELAIALETRIIAFQAKPSLSEYRTVESLSPDWSETKAKLLAYLRQANDWMAREAKVDIFLQEGLVDDAIASVSSSTYSYSSSTLVMRVMDAAIESHSDWVIKVAQREAEQIMDAGNAKAYGTAVKWLQRIQRAYAAQGKDATWDRYSEKIASTHGRKYKLMGLMETTGLR
ncbi:SWIM zinc finger family protein [Leptothoe sp. PORK10 BA2]|uniref:SWIM zinc finger family protein n=1 Tax=Leptothoe sp. PORK10 BA2 TaxID=3110254 RepID=UPI002B21F26F|nr:SWIM zinc finger family protein [Leptothoe sp. PORK10 BA2]MEA5465114.1 SWIM zinc finger family protein [Leptothoe sp. PORK10 BA2]